jgi:hypothetical protein
MSDPWDRDYISDEDPTYFDDGAERARQKLAAFRDGTAGARPAGRFVGPVVLAVVLGTIFGVGLLVLGAIVALSMDERHGDPPGAIFLAVFGIPGGFIIGLAVKAILDARADTPRRTLRLFYRLLGKGKFAAARRLVLSIDFDAFPRFHPRIFRLGQPKAEPFRFALTGAFGNFWKDLLRTHSSPYCLVKIGRIELQEVGPDAAVAEFELTLTMNTSLWMLTFLVIGILALVADIATRKVVKVRMRKVLLRVEDEWILLDGAWQGPEEIELSWLDPALAGR